jgi:hypothetical protein
VVALPISSRLGWLTCSDPLYPCAALAYYWPEPRLLVALALGWPEKKGKRPVTPYRDHLMATLVAIGATYSEIGSAWGYSEGGARARAGRGKLEPREPDREFTLKIEVVPVEQHHDRTVLAAPLDPASEQVINAALGLKLPWADLADDDRNAEYERAWAVIEQLAAAGKVQIGRTDEQL